MKKVSIITALLVGIGIFAFAIANPTSAAELFHGGPTGTEVGGRGRRGAIGTGTGVPMERNINLDGALSDLIHEKLAASLGITPEELTARLDGGETLSEIALSLGFDQTSVMDMISQARADALAQAVADGLITQEQADWLSSRGSMRAGSGNGSQAGTCDGTVAHASGSSSAMKGKRGHNSRGGQNH